MMCVQVELRVPNAGAVDDGHVAHYHSHEQHEITYVQEKQPRESRKQPKIRFQSEPSSMSTYVIRLKDKRSTYLLLLQAQVKI